MHKALFVFSCLLFTGFFSGNAQHQEYTPDPDPAIQQRIEDWKDLKFGILFHWGPYSQWGIVESWSICPEDLSWATEARKKEYSASYTEYVRQYEALQTTFNPVRFNPERWAAAAQEAGMRYVVITTKHHDGFCMWNTQYTDYKITGAKTPFASHPRSDVIGEVFNAFRKENFWIGAYFSKPDWHSDAYWWDRFPPSDRNANYSIQKYPERWQAFVEYTHNQIDELVSNYGKVDILWLDGGWVRVKTQDEIIQELKEEYEGSRWARNPQSQDIQMGELVRKARAKQPGLIVVDRAVPGPYQNYLTPENHIPETGLPYPWETCMPMGTSWSHVPNERYKTTTDLIHKLADIVAKGGNLLLNIGPRPDGELDEDAYSRLREIGAWLQTNGEAIYGTRPFTTYREGEDVRYTQSKDRQTVYVIFLKKPTESSMTLQSLDIPKGSKVSVLGSGEKIKWTKAEQGTHLSLAPSLFSSGQHAWVLKVAMAP